MMNTNIDPIKELICSTLYYSIWMWRADQRYTFTTKPIDECTENDHSLPFNDFQMCERIADLRADDIKKSEGNK